MPSQMNDFVFHLRAMSRLIYVVTDEEDRFLVKLRDALTKAKSRNGTHFVDRCWVYDATYGLVLLKTLIEDWTKKALNPDRETISIHDTLQRIYKDDPKEDRNFYVITDPERWLSDAHVVRRVRNILHQAHNDIRTLKLVIFVGTRKVLPEALVPYAEVIQDPGLGPDDILTTVETACKHLEGIEPPPNAVKVFAGLNSFQIDMAIAHSIVATKKDDVNSKRIDPTLIAEFKKRHLRKTDLLSLLDDLPNFAEFGGNERFKEWAKETQYAWTEEGQRFGLKPPKGVLLVGIWGCGKSLGSKAMAHAWGLPVIQLEMGKLRSSHVGQSEQNILRALKIIESAAPCVVWVDEAEKGFSGGQSSAESDAGTTSRMIGILSTWIQETTAQVCLALTANSLRTLPIEFVNRMDERFFFDLPNDDERIEILKIHLAKNRQKPANYNLADLAEKAKGMVGREIEQAIQGAMRKSFVARKTALDEAILGECLASKPRILKTMVDEVRELIEWVGYDPDANDGIKARLASAPREGSSFKIVEGG